MFGGAEAALLLELCHALTTVMSHLRDSVSLINFFGSTGRHFSTELGKV